MVKYGYFRVTHKRLPVTSYITLAVEKTADDSNKYLAAVTFCSPWREFEGTVLTNRDNSFIDVFSKELGRKIALGMLQSYGREYTVDKLDQDDIKLVMWSILNSILAEDENGDGFYVPVHIAQSCKLDLVNYGLNVHNDPPENW